MILALLSLSLLSCLAQNLSRWWRHAKPLLLFHIGLLGIALSALVSGLTYFHGAFQLAVEQSVQNRFVATRQGPLYQDRLGDFEFSLISSQVELHEKDLGIAVDEHVVEIKRNGAAPVTEKLQFNKPVLYGHYRFYLAFTKGYALEFHFTDEDGVERPGIIFLPRYPESREGQSRTFRIPGTSLGQLSASVDLATSPYSFDERWNLTDPVSEPVTLSYHDDKGRQRAIMSPGEEIKLADGLLRFEGYRTWHGFIVDYDPARPFLAAFTAFALAGLLWHFYPVLWSGSNRAKWQKSSENRPVTASSNSPRKAQED